MILIRLGLSNHNSYRKKVSLCAIHIPPIRGIPVPPEWQLIIFVRLYHTIKFMREHHPMRYNRMTEILKTVASIKLSSTFLLKSYFMKRPLTMLIGLYFFIVFGTGYVVFALERRYGTCMQYLDVVWLMAVTLTNLGFGDFTPSFVLSRKDAILLTVIERTLSPRRWKNGLFPSLRVWRTTDSYRNKKVFKSIFPL